MAPDGARSDHGFASADGSPGVIDPASFRDPAGYVFRRDGVLYRAIQPVAADDWAAFGSSLGPELIGAGLLVDHAGCVR